MMNRRTFIAASVALSTWVVVPVCAQPGDELSAGTAPESEERQREIKIRSCLLKIYADKKREREVIKEFSNLVLLKPDDQKLRLNFARYLARTGLSCDAMRGLAELEKAVELDGDVERLASPVRSRLKNTLDANKATGKDPGESAEFSSVQRPAHSRKYNGDFIRETEDSRIRKMLHQRAE